MASFRVPSRSDAHRSRELGALFAGVAAEVLNSADATPGPARAGRPSREETMQPEQDRPTVSIAPNNPVFDLPVIVGIEQGLFAKAGLDVSFSARSEEHTSELQSRPH